ncbi:IS3 family transposase [Kocuria rhizophila]|uniref:IS3 family transposase n=3 Tax=Kocuria rhizophila TaxID=72000 RepID=UPI0021A56306|nr:IS3 family transposase [Kocuria rhizophila]MCT1456508.1 IS3 family transposase [Kocuria rhizophila]WSQ04637.1 IS3 family transposase [Kocuria rhizophila]WSQ04651.1 IS3 family transposase [Kocuria rhizophila]WSQ04656.1 IS3 family transposase [Kocuria rhizophila]
MPAPYPQEFREDVVRVARSREDGVTIAQIAKDFGVHKMTLHKWIRQADIDDGNRPGKTREDSTELRELRRRNRLLEQENEVLRRAAAYLSQANLPKRWYPLVSELAADNIPVAVSLRVLKLSRQPYYRWRHQQVTTAELTEAYRANALLDAHRDDPEFGYRFLVSEAAESGEVMCERTAWRICRDNQWWSVFGKKRGKNGKRPGPPVHDDLVKRDFSADDVNELWLTDITEHWTDEGKLYLCAIKDVFSGRIVGYSMSDRMKACLAVNALDNAVSRRRDAAGCIVHSDRGSQFRSRKFVHALNRNHLIGSMGQVGAAGDNAAMESFFALLQKNVLDRRRWRTREELRIAIITWIERTYHRRRRQARLGRLTPIEYETIMNPAVSLAA